MKLPKNCSVHFTQYGYILLILDLFLFVVSILSGKFTIFLIVTFIFSLFVISFIIGFINLTNLSFFRRIPSDLYRFKPALFELGIKNNKKYLDSFLITVQDVIDGFSMDKSCYFFKISPQKQLSTFYRHAFAERGHFTFSDIYVSSIFPLGLFRFVLIKKNVEQILIFPDFQKNKSFTYSSDTVYDSNSAFNLRNYIPGDHLKSIHWSSSFKKQTLISRISDTEIIQPVWLRFDNSLILCEEGYVKTYEIFERKISFLVSYAWYLIYTGYEVGIITRGDVLHPIAGISSFRTLLIFCSTIRFSDLPFYYNEAGNSVIDI